MSNQNPPIIGLAGHARSGKDTVAATLELAHGYEAWAIEDNVREALYSIDPVIGSEKSLGALVDQHGWADLQNHRFYAPEVRRLIRATAETGRAIFGPLAWLNSLGGAIADTGGLGLDRPIVITDVHLSAEAQWVHDQGGSIWRITRQGAGPVPGDGVRDDQVDITICNDASIKDLTALIQQALGHSSRLPA